MRAAWSIILPYLMGALAAIAIVALLNLLAWAGHMAASNWGNP